MEVESGTIERRIGSAALSLVFALALAVEVALTNALEHMRLRQLWQSTSQQNFQRRHPDNRGIGFAVAAALAMAVIAALAMLRQLR